MPTAVTTEAVEEAIRDALAEMGTERSHVSREATFEQLDVDSLDLVELAQIVEDDFGVALDGADVKDMKTIGDAIDLIVARSR